MTANERTFRLPLADGVQMVRLDQDSLDYDWKGDDGRFHGTLPYENLRPHNRVTRKNNADQSIAAISGLLLVAALAADPKLDRDWIHWAVILLGVIFVLSIKRAFAPSVTCLQIDPPPYGFNDTLTVPNSKAGRAFLDALIPAWDESLRSRFLPRPSVPHELNLHRLDWLEHVGAISASEADDERRRMSADPDRHSLAIADYSEPLTN